MRTSRIWLLPFVWAAMNCADEQAVQHDATTPRDATNDATGLRDAPALRGCRTAADCNDHIACTMGSCDEGACTQRPCTGCCEPGLECDARAGCAPPPRACLTDADCDDGVRCTLDVCGPESTCSRRPEDGLCAPGEVCLGAGCIPDRGACTSVDECVAHRPCDGNWACGELGCEFLGAIDCDDHDACTADRCDGPGGCTHDPIDIDGDGHGPEGCGGDDCDDTSEAAHPGASESCDGIDEDCDGAVDEGLGTRSCGFGPCVRVVPHCVDGHPVSCDSPVGSGETCDGIDGDCDGRIDEGIPDQRCGDGACERTITGCEDGRVPGCNPGAPSAESCNGIDDDCDGSVDDAVEPMSCGTGACFRTVEACVAGTPAACVPGTPSTETCNALDDDCNGVIDDGAASRSCGAGACLRTVAGCVGDCTPGVPGAERCGDAIDDDCDGVVDESLQIEGSDTLVPTMRSRAVLAEVLWTGSEYGVLWADARDIAPGSEPYFRRVTASGVAYGGEVRIGEVGIGATLIGDLDLAGHGGGYLATYALSGKEWETLQLQRLATDGTPIGSATTLPADFIATHSGDAVWNGSEYGVVFAGRIASNPRYGIWFQRLAADGTLVGAAVPIATPASTRLVGNMAPHIVWTGTEYGVSWQDGRHAVPLSPTTAMPWMAVYFARVSSTGTLLGADQRISELTHEASESRIAFDGGQYALVWANRDDAPSGRSFDVRARRVTSAGVPIGPVLVVDDPPSVLAHTPAITAGRSGFLLAYVDATAPRRVYLRELSATGSLGPPIGLSGLGTAEHFPALAWSGTDYAVAWSDVREERFSLYFRRLSTCL